VKDTAEVSVEDALQPGSSLVAAGYCMYGSSCTVKLAPIMQIECYKVFLLTI